MDPLTISTATITLNQGTTPVAGTVTYAAVGTTATFTPASGLAPLTTFTATVTTGAKDLAGNALATGFSWSFTTGATPDTTPPTVTLTVPANTATAVAINQTVNATFSEAMDPATISTADFLVTGPGAIPVVGTVGYNVSSKIATFTPASNLAANTVYGATITTGVRDLAGNALASNFAWSFTTAATTAGQAPVVLGSATTFSVLAASTVTSTGAATVNGDLGLSPGTAVTGFPPGVVNGTTHLGDAAAAQAQLDLTTAYNDAAGRTVGAILVAGNLGGQTLTPGLYTSTSSLEISSGDLTLDAQGDANAVFIFQMASTLTTTSGRQVILSGGAQAANIFWQVGSSATLGTTSVFKGNILALTSITVTTGAAVEGRLLARNGAVTFDSNTVGFFITTPAATGILQSAALPTDPYTDTPGQSLDLATKTITVPLSGGMQFYRIRSTTALTITSITISGGNVVITYN
jgi:ice-binding like protein/Big-like domain-containing protein